MLVVLESSEMFVVLTSLLALQTMLVSSQGQTDYCQLSAEHTMCVYRAGELGRTCGVTQQRGVTTSQAEEIVNLHNRLRSTVASASTGGSHENGKENISNYQEKLEHSVNAEVI